jgi:orotidine-5'-phosphate decarboxylase
MNGAERVIFALDVDNAADALAWAERLRGRVGVFKVGLELFVAEGPELLREFERRGLRVFLDLKFHDIPNTVAGAVRSAARYGAFLVNVHALAGSEAMKRAAEAAREGAKTAGREPPKVIAVTVLTSHGPETLGELGISGTPAEAVLRFARLAKASGLDGVVASPEEASAIRALWPEGLVVTPGVRPLSAAADDQVRVATPGGAIRAGADYLVVGRPIRAAADPAVAADAIAREVAEALQERPR